MRASIITGRFEGLTGKIVNSFRDVYLVALDKKYSHMSIGRIQSHYDNARIIKTKKIDTQVIKVT